MSNPAAALRVARPVVAPPAGVEAAGTDYVVVDRVSKFYNEGSRQQVEAVAPSSFAIKAGEFVALLGPSGCGKSTLLMMIAGLDAPSRGTIGVAGQALVAPRAETGIMFQDPTLLPWKSALDNVLFPFHPRGRLSRRPRAGDEPAARPHHRGHPHPLRPAARAGDRRDRRIQRDLRPSPRQDPARAAVMSTHTPLHPLAGARTSRSAHVIVSTMKMRAWRPALRQDGSARP